MADDIDIEEHDLFENPELKRIFPDLSVLKEEVIDFDEENLSQQLNSAQADVINGYINKCNTTTSFKSNKLFNCEKRKEEIAQQSNNTILFGKVVLEDISLHLKRSKTFCEKCLILFQGKESFINHEKTHSNSSLKTKTKYDINICGQKRNKHGIRGLQSSTKSKRSNKNIYPIDNLNRKKYTAKIPKNELNVMVKINEYHENEEETISFKACFHCDMQFLTQQDLIDHLYDVLNAKKAEVSLPKQTEIPSDLKTNKSLVKPINVEHKTKIIDLNNIYSCPICSYYFSTEKFYMGHVVLKHKVTKKMAADKVVFNPMCKFCRRKNVDIFSYNSHLRLSHKNEIVKKMTVRNNITTSNINETKKDNRMLKKVNNARPLPSKISSVNYKLKDVKVMVSKTILFKCTQCQLHFLTNKAATNHYEHSTITKYWYCASCKNLFRDNDAVVHKKQHKLSNFFSIIKVIGESQPKVLYKCPMCAVHFSKNSYDKHLSECETNGPKSSYCRICHILIETDIKTCHEYDHTIRNMMPSEFKIIESEKTLFKCNKNVETSSEGVNKSDTSTYATPTDVKNTISPPKKIIRFTIDRLSRLSYCNVCKCHLYEDYDIYHRQHCINMKNIFCDFCGIYFTPHSIGMHKKLHLKYKMLKLQDNTFFNVETKEMMRPAFPDYPKCTSCGVNFISLYDVTVHVCSSVIYETCHICKEKFTKSVYKFHMSIHMYKLPGQYCSKVTYTCNNCDLSMNNYDEVIEHCHMHTNLNKIDESAFKCAKCHLKFTSSSYKKHLELPKNLDGRLTHICFDVFHFGSERRIWLSHLFKRFAELNTNDYLKDSIYRYEERIHMEVAQDGPSNLTIYKCDKCQCIIDPFEVMLHISNCAQNNIKGYCSFCGLTFISSATKDKHEEIHTNAEITLNSFKIVLFNRDRDFIINQKIANMMKTYSLYECRYCHVIVEKENYNTHKCGLEVCKKCYTCGLIISEAHYSLHTLKHETLNSFNEKQIKIVLLGKKIENDYIEVNNSNLIPTFSGIVCDYTFYECANCNVCVKHLRNTFQHYCLIDAAKSECPKCNLTFDEGKLKGHLKLHDTDPEFTRDTITVKPFDNRKSIKIVCEPNFVIDQEEFKEEDKIDDTEPTMSLALPQNRIKLYKCCCGLHFIDEISMVEHKNKCSGKQKGQQGNQNCSKCGLTFSPKVLFKHLLEHHGDRNIENKFEIDYVYCAI